MARMVAQAERMKDPDSLEKLFMGSAPYAWFAHRATPHITRFRLTIPISRHLFFSKRALPRISHAPVHALRSLMPVDATTAPDIRVEPRLDTTSTVPTDSIALEIRFSHQHKVYRILMPSDPVQMWGSLSNMQEAQGMLLLPILT